MKCPNCNGTGNIANGMWLCCECEGTGYIEDEMPQKMLTNEEWFCGLSTEEKARFFVMIEMSAMHPVKRGSIDTKKFIEDVTEWLKQPHKEIEK